MKTQGMSDVEDPVKTEAMMQWRYGVTTEMIVC